MPRQPPPDAETWTDCAPGTLSELSRNLHRARRRKTIRRVGTPLLVIALVGLGVWSVNAPTGPSEFTFGGICCSEVQLKLPQYAAGGLERDERRAVGTHLERCPICQEKLRAMQGHLKYGDKIMLVLSRKPGQRIVVGFGDQVATLTLLKVQGNRVQIGIEAPSSVGVHRQEVWARLVLEADSPGSGEAEPGRAVA